MVCFVKLFGSSQSQGVPVGLAVSFFLYGISVIPFTYCLSFLFTSHSTAQNVMIMIYLVAGNALTLLSTLARAPWPQSVTIPLRVAV